jgi:glycosyltransferase involved in cell wall biosynthesis
MKAFDPEAPMLNNTHIEDGVSIVVTAKSTKDYILNTLDSIYQSIIFGRLSKFEVIVFIDGDPDIYALLKDEQRKNLIILYSERNVGAYIAFNTAVTYSKYSHVLRFDSDDLMYENMLSELDRFKEDGDIIYCKADLQGRKYLAVGIIFAKRTVFDYMGGFKPWYCAADRDFYNRASKALKVHVIEDSLFKIVERSDSLTHAEDTGSSSHLRSLYHEIMSLTDYTSTNCVIAYKTSPYQVHKVCGFIDETGDVIRT